MVQPDSSLPAPSSIGVGDVAYLTVREVNATGAFLDWGQPKDLLLPFSEQRFPPHQGRRVLVKVLVDDQQRPVASMRLDRFISDEAWSHHRGDRVALVVAEQTDLGFKVVVDQRFWGLIHQEDVVRPLRRGLSMQGFVKQRREDGRLDIALLPQGEARIDVVADQVIQALRESGGTLGLGDKSPAEEIKHRLGISKGAFKQATGRLYKQKRITLEAYAIHLISDGDDH